MDANSAPCLQWVAPRSLYFIRQSFFGKSFVHAKMEEFQSALAGLNETVILWIAGGVAAIFVLAILFDSVRRSRRDRARTNRRSSTAVADANYPSGFFKRLRFIFQTLGEEISKRERRNERSRNREK